MSEKKVRKIKKSAEKVEKQTAISVILLVAIGAFIGFVIGYALFRAKILGA